MFSSRFCKTRCHLVLLPNASPARFVLIIFVIGIADFLIPCTIGYRPPCQFDPSEYIFIGKVVGYVGPIEADNIPTLRLPELKRRTIEYFGILTAIKEEIYLPSRPENYFEVFPYSLGSDCSLHSYSLERLEDKFPVGTEIRVVGKWTEHLIFEISKGNIRLDVIPFNQFDVSLNLKIPKYLYSTSQSEFDYLITNFNSLDSLANEFSKSLNIQSHNEEIRLSNSVFSLQDFEIRKDLYKLTTINNDTLKSEIIMRMKNFQYYSPNDLLTLIDTYIESDLLRRYLIDILFIVNGNATINQIFRRR